MKRIFVAVSKKLHRLDVYSGAKAIRSFTVSVGKRNDGIRKIVRGDLRTPEGLYRIVEKKTLDPARPGRHGTRWLRLDYPNRNDIETGAALGLISPGFRNKLLAGRSAGKRLRTILGHGIGIHGTDSPRTIGTDETEGCVRMKNRDIEILYDIVDIDTPVILR